MIPVSNIWAPYPFVRFVCAYITGIILYSYFPSQLYPGYFLTASGLFFVLIFLVWEKYFFNSEKYSRYATLVGFVSLVLLTLSGYSACVIVNATNAPVFTSVNASAYRVVLAEEPVHRNTINRAEADVTHVRINDKWTVSGGKILVSFAADDISDSLHNGSVILFEKTPEKISNSGNPGAPDFAKLWGNKFLYYRLYLRSHDYTCTGYEKPPFYVYYPDQAALFLASLLSKYIHSPHEKGVALALFLGIKEGIDNELLQSYSAAGAMHVLAVSGMHVAVLFQLFSMLLGRIPFLRKYERSSQVLLLIFIWFYGFITGASASVMRAVVMFSFVVMGKLLGRRSNIYNSVCLSAFALLLYNPYLLFDVGFQLSYLAVLGIVFLQPRLDKFWSPDGTIAGYFADIIKVSVAAQIATFPLSVYYFQQFPTYFLLSNLVIIPISAGAMYAGIFLMFTHWITPLAIVSGFVTEYLLMLMNYAVAITEILPLSVISGIKINALQCICLYLLIVLPVAMVTFKKIKFAFGLTFIALIFSAATFSASSAHKEYLLFYNLPDTFAMEHISGSSSRLYTLNADSLYLKKVIAASHSFLGIARHHVFSLPDSGSVVCNIAGKTVVLYSGKKNVQLPDSCSVLVINSEYSEKQFETLTTISCQELLISSALPSYQRLKWKNKLSEKNISVVDVSEGAYVVK